MTPNSSPEPTRTGMALGRLPGVVHHPASGPGRPAGAACLARTFNSKNARRSHCRAMRTLVIPPAAQRDDNSVKMLSAWIAEQGLHCTLNIGFFEASGHSEAKAWGILLADLARHIGNAVAEERGAPARGTVAAVVTSMLAELDLPTSGAVGEFHVGHA